MLYQEKSGNPVSKMKKRVKDSQSFIVVLFYHKAKRFYVLQVMKKLSTQKRLFIIQKVLLTFFNSRTVMAREKKQ
jgi:hypothetical protein